MKAVEMKYENLAACSIRVTERQWGNYYIKQNKTRMNLLMESKLK